MAGALNIAATRFQRTQGMPALNRARRRQYADGGDVAADPGYVDNGDWDTNQATTSADQPSQGGVLSQRGAQTQSPDPASAQKIYALQSAQAILAAARSGSAPVPSQQPGAINLPLLAAAGALMAPTPGGAGASIGNAFTAGAGALQQQRETDEKARLANVQADALNLQNLSAASTLPVTIARNQTMTRILSDPSFLQQLQGAPGSSPTPTPSSYASAVTGEEGAGKNPLSSATGPGQFIDGTWQSFAKENPQYFSGMSPTQIMAARSDPTLGALATDWLATKNAGALQAYGVPPSGQSLALAHYLGPKAAAAVMQAPPDMPASTAVANVLGKDKAAEYVQANPNLAAMTSGGLRNRYSNIPDPGQGSGDGAASSQQALNVAGQYEAQANRIELAKSLGLPIPGDPAALRAAAQQWRQLALAGPEALAKVPGALAEKGFRSTPGGGLEPIPGGEADPGYVSQKAGAEAAGKAPYSLQRVPPGGVLFDATGKSRGFAPLQSEEVITEGPNAGMRVTVLRNPITNEIIGSSPSTQNGTGAGTGAAQSGGAAPSGLPPGAIPRQLPPQQEGRLHAQGQIEADDIKHDRKTVEEDLAHVIDTAQPAQQQLLQLRDLAKDADTGAAGEFRMQMKNWFQTFAPDQAKNLLGDAAPAQEFTKVALMNAGKQERGDLGARGGFRAIEMYANANPNLNMQPNANQDMANALLISHQRNVDYTQGAVDHYQRNRAGFMDPQAPQPYSPISTFDQKFTQVFKPELYYSAINAINGKPQAEWSKGLTPPQVQIVGGIVKRADPNASINISGKMIPVSAFKNTIDPTEIMGQDFGKDGSGNGR